MKNMKLKYKLFKASGKFSKLTSYHSRVLSIIMHSCAGNIQQVTKPDVLRKPNKTEGTKQQTDKASQVSNVSTVDPAFTKSNTNPFIKIPLTLSYDDSKNTQL
jgi:hypothetical protein